MNSIEYYEEIDRITQRISSLQRKIAISNNKLICEPDNINLKKGIEVLTDELERVQEKYGNLLKISPITEQSLRENLKKAFKIYKNQEKQTKIS